MKYNTNKPSEHVPMRDMSGHTKHQGPVMSNSIKQSNPTPNKPLPVHHSLKHHERRYIPDTCDHDGHDAVLDVDGNIT